MHKRKPARCKHLFINSAAQEAATLSHYHNYEHLRNQAKANTPLIEILPADDSILLK